jgi:hypothetical protein
LGADLRKCEKPFTSKKRKQVTGGTKEGISGLRSEMEEVKRESWIVTEGTTTPDCSSARHKA